MNLRDFYALLLRLFLGYVFVSSGLCKLTDGHFGQLIGPPRLIETLAPYGLHLFGLFIATSQVLVGALVLSQRYSLLGLVALVPMNASILAVTVSQNWTGTPVVNSVLLALNGVALLYEWPTLRVFLLPDAALPLEKPRTNLLFPDAWLPAGALLAALVAAIISRYQPSLTVIPATVLFLCVYGNVVRSPYLTWLEKGIVAVTLGGILCVTYGSPNGFVAAAGLLLVLLAIYTAKALIRPKSRLMSLPVFPTGHPDSQKS